MEQKIKLSNLLVAVKRVKNASNGCIVVECEDTESLQRLQNQALAELSANYDVEIPKIVNPKITIVGVQEEYLREEDIFVKKIESRSNLKNVQKLKIKLLKKFKSKIANRCNVWLEISPVVFKNLLNSGRVFLDWDSCLIYKHLGVIRC